MRMLKGAILTAVMCAGVVGGRAETRALDNYRSIIDRNPFGLKPILPPPEKPEVVDTKPAEKSEFYLTGITTHPRYPKKAYLVNKDQSKKDFAEKYYTLTVGDRQGDVTLNEIDEKGRRVKITYQGKETWLDFKSNKAPDSAPPMQAMAPGMPGQPGLPPPPGSTPVPLPGAIANAAASAPQPNANPNRRMPRGGNGMVNVVPSQPMSAPQGPQTDEEVLKQIIELQNPQKFQTPSQQAPLRYPVPAPPSPTFGNTPTPPSP